MKKNVEHINDCYNMPDYVSEKIREKEKEGIKPKGMFVFIAWDDPKAKHAYVRTGRNFIRSNALWLLECGYKFEKDDILGEFQDD